MQKTLVGLLIFLVIAPSLVCAMPICAEDMPSMKMMEAPCPDHPATLALKQNNVPAIADAPMLMADCLDTELLSTSKNEEWNASFSKDSSFSTLEIAKGTICSLRLQSY